MNHLRKVVSKVQLSVSEMASEYEKNAQVFLHTCCLRGWFDRRASSEISHKTDMDVTEA